MARGWSLREHGQLKVAVAAWALTSLLIVVSVLNAHPAWGSNPLQVPGALQRDAEFGIIAHRGAASLAPENTLAAFRIAIELQADFVETDVQLTADGVPVLMHDPDLDRTTSGSGPIANHTLEQLRSLDAGSWFSPEFAGEPVPTLVEFIELIGPTATNAFVELKGDWPAEKVEEVVSLLHTYQLSRRVVLASFERPTLDAVREAAPDFAVILLTRKIDKETVDYAIQLGASAVCARQKLFVQNQPRVSELREAGIGTISYTLNTERQWKQAARHGIDFFVTDKAHELTAWRGSRDN